MTDTQEHDTIHRRHGAFCFKIRRVPTRNEMGSVRTQAQARARNYLRLNFYTRLRAQALREHFLYY